MCAEFRAGPANLNNPMRVDTAPEGEDIACENWSKYEQKTAPHALSGYSTLRSEDSCLVSPPIRA